MQKVDVTRSGARVVATAATSDWLVRLGDTQDVGRVGGKAGPLARAMAAGLSVPEGFVITAGAAASGIEAVAAAVEAELAALGEGRFAVRSSAVGEDGRKRSFAGQLATTLEVERDGVLAAVVRCWESARALRALCYGGQIGDVAVLVQRMVDPDAAGVAFSADPLSGRRDVTVVEAVPSLAEGLVSGAVDPERWRLESGHTRRVAELDRPVLTADQARRVADLASTVAELFGAPQDVEWALSGEELWLLQSRPITALPAEPVPIPIAVPEGGGWDRDDHHGVLSPLGWSWFQPYPEELCEAFRSVGAPLEAMECTRIGGQLYMRVVMAGGESSKLPPRWVLWLAARLAPPLRRANRIAEAFLDEERFMEPYRQWHGGLRDELVAELETLEVDDLTLLEDDELLEGIARVLAFTEKSLRQHAWLHAPQMFGLGKLVLFVEDELGWDADRVIRLVTGSSEATTEMHRQLETIMRRHAGELEGIEAIPRSWSALLGACPTLGREICAWLADNRLRMLHYDPKHPTLGERPTYVLSILDGILADLRREPQGEPGQDHLAEALAEAEQQLSEEALAEFRRLLELAQRGYALRDDNGVDTVSRPVGLLRQWVLELGRRIEGDIGHSEHAVYLYPEEHAPALRGELEGLAALVERRRGEESWALRNRGPRRYGPPKPPSPPADVFPRGMARLMRILDWMDRVETTPEPSGGDVLRGVGVGSRVVRGRARVIHHPERMATLRHGEIVVCRITSPEWAVALGRVAALVTNEGGLLSHPAIIAREFDVPAVVGVEGATERIATGDRIVVDPVAGTVRLAD